MDVLHNPNLDGDIGSDGSTPQDRANGAGFHGPVTETVAINPALAISGIEMINQWYGNPADYAIMANCTNSQMGVWSENSLNRTVVVAVYGQSSQHPSPPQTRPTGPPPIAVAQQNIPLDTDYDASDEIEHALNWLPWAVRGVSPPPAIPPQ